MREVIFAADSVYDPIGKPASIHVVQANGPQHANMQRLQLGEPYRSDARRKVGFDDARRIRPLFKRTDVHRYVRPSRPCNAFDERRDSRVAVAEQNITGIKYPGE